ncbi:MAG: N-6 DNA methylase [Bacteroidaceae bacterium]|nr:N-6 DNA methylase [Bacteroidaceae bacterium]
MAINNQQTAARRFVETWKGRGYEKGETQPFWYQLLHDIFGIEVPANFIQFELPVHIKHTKFIDAYIPSTKVLIEQKELKKDLDAAGKQSDGEDKTPYEQADRYASGLKWSQYPRWIVTCNFRTFKIYDKEQPKAEPLVISLDNLEHEYYLLKFLVDDTATTLKKEKEISKEAGELIAKLYNLLRSQYVDPDTPRALHSLNVLCIRLVFCLFAEKSFLFGDNRSIFRDYMVSFKPSQMRRALLDLFDILDTPEDERDPYLSEELARFPYVNGGLFNKNDNLEIPAINESIANLLIRECSEGFDWSGISPTIFGALFEDTMNPETRESGGMHYTSVENIHKVIDPLFMNRLNIEFKEILKIKTDKKRKQALLSFQEKIGGLTFLDPACGSGNFLTETYLSLRKLENEILGILSDGTLYMNGDLSPIKVKIEHFYGMEVNDFAVTVAKAALWIAEAQMMKETEGIVQKDLEFLPLKSYSHIHQANALTTDWKSVVTSDSLSFIFGNPPFKGKKSRKKEQKEELESVIGTDSPQPGNMDYVTGWFFKAARYIQNTNIKVAFVSTINITRGEQVSLLWNALLNKYHIAIDYAHLPFEWYSEAKKSAQVHCTVIGFSSCPNGAPKVIYSGTEEVAPKIAQNISPYLRDEENILVASRPSKPICKVPETGIGNKPIDGGNFLFKPKEKEDFIKKEPLAAKYFYEWYGSDELIKGHHRYFLWLANCPPSELRKMPLSKERKEKVKEARSKSSDAGTRKLADFPTKFHVTNIPQTNFMVIPEVTSENRNYIPMEYVEVKDTTKKLFSNLVKLMPGATLYHFGVLQSMVHMIWTKAICGYKDFRPRYSTDVVYNNFPWPDVSQAVKKSIEKTAKKILDAKENARKKDKNCSLADLYDVNSMPDDLKKAHLDNDKAVMAAYGFTGKNEEEVIKALLQLYKKLTTKK